MVDNIMLIWLDNNINEDDADARNTLLSLRRLVNPVSTFTDSDDCVESIESNDNEKIYIITSGTLGKSVVPRIHHLIQVESIFVFCVNKESHEQWASSWAKIQGVFTEINPICDALEKVATLYERNSMSFHFSPTTADKNYTNTNCFDSKFLYTQILKMTILNIEPKQDCFQEFLTFCRSAFANMGEELNTVKKLEKKYQQKSSIRWFTSQTFLYSMLNRALRVSDINLIMILHFFIVDLHRQIRDLHIKQFGDDDVARIIIVYSGQGMSKRDFDKMSETQGGLMSFTNFFFANKTNKVAYEFAQDALSNPISMGVVFVITIDSSIITTPFGLSREANNGQGEDPIFFSMHTVFRIQNIKPISGKQRLFQVDLTLPNDNDTDFNMLTTYIQQNICCTPSGWERLGSVLFKMDYYDKAEQVYNILLIQTTSDQEKKSIYNQLGWMNYSQAKYDVAITFYEKSLEISKTTVFPCDSNLAASYNNIALLYFEIGEYSKAISFYEQALEIQQQSLSSVHMDLSSLYNDIGAVYRKMDDYPKALLYYQESLEIQEKLLPPTHPDLVNSYNNLGLLHSNMKSYSEALSYYEKAFQVQKQSLPAAAHPQLISCYNNFGSILFNLGEYSKAISSYENALKIRKDLLPSTHPDLAASYNNIGLTYFNMGEYSKALSYYEEGLDIQKQSLPSNHPHLAWSNYNIGNVYKSMGEQSKALSYYKQAVDIGQRTLPSTHSDLQQWQKAIDVTRTKF